MPDFCRGNLVPFPSCRNRRGRRRRPTTTTMTAAVRRTLTLQMGNRRPVPFAIVDPDDKAPPPSPAMNLSIVCRLLSVVGTRRSPFFLPESSLRRRGGRQGRRARLAARPPSCSRMKCTSKLAPSFSFLEWPRLVLSSRRLMGCGRHPLCRPVRPDPPPAAPFRTGLVPAPALPKADVPTALPYRRGRGRNVKRSAGGTPAGDDDPDNFGYGFGLVFPR
jgi:hypothetical protein